MGRTLDALKHSSPRSKAGSRGLLDSATPSTASHQAPEENSDAMPFIEVGGPGRLVEASAGILPPLINGTSAAGATMAAGAHNKPIASPSQPEGPTSVAAPRPLVFQPLSTQTVSARPPWSRFTSDLIAYHSPHHPVSEQYRAIIARMMAQYPLGGKQVLLLTSASAQAGTTTVLLNLAITQVQHSASRVAVVDANLRHPSVAERLGLELSPGLRDVIGGRLSVSRAIQETGLKNLFALTGGEPYQGTTSWPSGDTIRKTLQQLRSHFDLVLVDGPAWNAGPETVALVGGCDAVYLVLRPSEANSPRASELMGLIPHLGSYVAGYLLTQQ